MRIFVFFYLGLLLACNASQKTAPPEEILEPEQKMEEPRTKLTIKLEEPFYLHLEGLIGDYPIAMELASGIDLYTGDADFEGYYYYTKYGEPISLYGYLDSLNQIVLEESDFEGNPTGAFRGVLLEDGAYRGEWTNGKQNLTFDLKPQTNQNLVQFDALFFMDSLIIEPGNEDSPGMHLKQSWLYPRFPKDPELENYLRLEIRKNVLGDSLALLYTDPAMAFAAEKKAYFSDYEKEAREWLKEQKESGEAIHGWAMSYDYENSMHIYFNSEDILTLGYYYYSYTGGAHGNYGTGVYAYDLKRQKALELKDVFKPGYEPILRGLLEGALRKKFELTPQQALSDILFENYIEPTENFGLTDKGVFFLYNPYEIAAYSFGQIQLFIAFDELKESLK